MMIYIILKLIEDDENIVKDEFGNLIGENSSMYIENMFRKSKIINYYVMETNELSKKESKWVMIYIYQLHLIIVFFV